MICLMLQVAAHSIEEMSRKLLESQIISGYVRQLSYTLEFPNPILGAFIWLDSCKELLRELNYGLGHIACRAVGNNFKYSLKVI
jgi:hypothetical protein